MLWSKTELNKQLFLKIRGANVALRPYLCATLYIISRVYTKASAASKGGMGPVTISYFRRAQSIPIIKSHNQEAHLTRRSLRVIHEYLYVCCLERPDHVLERFCFLGPCEEVGGV